MGGQPRRAEGGLVLPWPSPYFAIVCLCHLHPGVSQTRWDEAYREDAQCASLLQRQALLQRPPPRFPRDRGHDVHDAEVLPPVDSSPIQETAPLAVPSGGVCITPSDLPAALQFASQEVLKGLPAWPRRQQRAVAEHSSVRIAFLVQVSVEERLPLVRRTFDRLHTPTDVFLYLVDGEKLAPSLVRDALGLSTQPQANVVVQEAPHAGFFYWPRVQVVLDGISTLLNDEWDFVIHLSESDYPVHSLSWLRHTLASQRNSNFILVQPRCTLQAVSAGSARAGEASMSNKGIDATSEAKSEDLFESVKSDWYWWKVKAAVASCGSQFEPRRINSVPFPLEQLEADGFVFAHASEWLVVTRELAEYATQPEMLQYNRLIGMHGAADEMYWSTMVLNIPNFTQSISRQGWYVHWPVAFQHSPNILTEAHEQDIMDNRNSFLFARKMNEVDSAKLMDKLDAAAAREHEASSSFEGFAGAWEMKLNRSSMSCVAVAGKAAPVPPSNSALSQT